MPFYYTFEMHQNKLSNEGILLKLLTGKEMHTNLEYVPIPIKEYEQMQIDILQYKKQIDRLKHEIEYEKLKFSNLNVYYAENTEKIQSKCKQLIEEMQCKIIEEIIIKY